MMCKQQYCKDCQRPINQNNYNSEKFDGCCSKCYRFNTTEKFRRKVDKKIVKKRKNQREFKRGMLAE